MNTHLLKTEELEIFIAALDEKPEHTVSIHQLRNDLAQAWVLGKPDDFQAAIVRWSGLPEYPLAFGEDATAIWHILRTLQNWEQIQISQTVAPQLSAVMQAELNTPIAQSNLLYFTQKAPLTIPPHDESVTIRILTESDIDIVKATPMDAQPLILKTLEATLRDEVVAGTIVDDRLIGFSESRAADKHVELGVHVDEDWRKRGIASAMAGLLIQHFQATNLKIIWATDEDNLASRRVAAKLGFQEFSRRVFLIPQQET
jgi:GNAT superfamily N-acetyltransferase